MTDCLNFPAARPPGTAPAASTRAWIAVGSVGVGTFALVTAEQLPVGLLTGVSGTLGITEGQAGLMVTMPGVVAGLAAPLLPLAVGRLDRRIFLVALMALMAVASLGSALAPTYSVLLASRFVVGLSIGGFWAIAGSLAVRLVPEASIPRATAIIFGGVAAANVLGIPLGTLIGEIAGWRIAFLALAGLSGAIFVSLMAALPRLPAARAVTLRELGEQARSPAVRAGIAATFVLVTAQFAAFTFVSPVLQTGAGIDSARVGPLLLAYGAAGILGNFLVGALVGRHLARTLLLIAAALGAVMLAFPLAGGAAWPAIGLLVLWGLAYGGVSVGLQSWMLRAAPQAAEAATALWVAVFNLAIALGALAGGLVVDGMSLTGIFWLAAALFFGTFVLIARGSRHLGRGPAAA